MSYREKRDSKMSESKIESASYSTNIVERRTSPLICTDEVFQSAGNSTSFENISQIQYVQ